jgi:hypothetical protein
MLQHGRRVIKIIQYNMLRNQNVTIKALRSQTRHCYNQLFFFAI